VIVEIFERISLIIIIKTDNYYKNKFKQCVTNFNLVHSWTECVNFNTNIISDNLQLQQAIKSKRAKHRKQFDFQKAS